MNLLASLKRPEYVFRPAQVFRRTMCSLRPEAPEYMTVKLPWGLPLRIQPNEAQGSLIRRLGVYDLHSCEIMSRLIDPGELAVDAGANMGQMTSLMAMRAGPRGQVISFEPHPVLFGELQYNIAAWKQDPQAAPISAHQLALSNREGAAQLVVPARAVRNQMLAFLADDAPENTQLEHYQVPVTTLPAIVPEGQPIGLMKIDVEGHELQVLSGAQPLMAAGNIRDILFEDHDTPPTPVTTFLEDNGYKIFRIGGRLSGPELDSIDTPFTSGVHGPPNFLATRDASRAKARMARRGWTANQRNRRD
jgi:FkbM family methyltransferase